MKLKLKKSKTYRGFELIIFKDEYGIPCSIQKSSLATENAIWFGVEDPTPMKFGKNGWEDCTLSKDISLHTRMHLTQNQVKQLLPILQNFAETGRL